MTDIEPQGGASMNLEHLGGVSEKKCNVNIEEILVRFDAYIVILVQHKARHSSNIAQPDIVDLEIDEIIQRVRIKLWIALLTKEIEHQKAYIRSIVSNEFNDLGRRRKLPLPLPVDEDGELYMGNVLVNQGEGLADPSVEFEKQEMMDDLMEFTAQVVTVLPPRMKQAMINHLNDQVDNLLRLTEAFERRKVNIKTMNWSDDPIETKRLKASISPARHIIARRVGLNLLEYKKWGVPEELIPSTMLDEFDKSESVC
jgi:DNA-directed RNA polymerase specialized sigma24 family protein